MLLDNGLNVFKENSIGTSFLEYVLTRGKWPLIKICL
jgi:hypothetical protein